MKKASSFFVYFCSITFLFLAFSAFAVAQEGMTPLLEAQKANFGLSVAASDADLDVAVSSPTADLGIFSQPSSYTSLRMGNINEVGSITSQWAFIKKAPPSGGFLSHEDANHLKLFYSKSDSLAGLDPAITIHPKGRLGVGVFSPKAALDIKGGLVLRAEEFKGSVAMTLNPNKVAVAKLECQVAVMGEHCYAYISVENTYQEGQQLTIYNQGS